MYWKEYCLVWNADLQWNSPGAIRDETANKIESFRQNVSTPPIQNRRARKEPYGSMVTLKAALKRSIVTQLLSFSFARYIFTMLSGKIMQGFSPR